MPSGGCRDKWHCLEKPEVTSLGSFSQCRCGQALGNSRALAVRCPQSLLPNPWPLPPTGGRGRREHGGGARGNKTRQEAQAGGGHSGPGTNSQHRKPQPTPAHPTRPKLRERGVPKAWYPNRSKSQGLAQGKGGARSTSVLSLPQTLPGEGERKPGWQGWCCLFKSTEILS